MCVYISAPAPPDYRELDAMHARPGSMGLPRRALTCIRYTCNTYSRSYMCVYISAPARASREQGFPRPNPHGYTRI